jgi:hypothetical protein
MIPSIVVNHRVLLLNFSTHNTHTRTRTQHTHTHKHTTTHTHNTHQHNKNTTTHNRTRLGNWYEERALREQTGVKKQSHIQYGVHSTGDRVLGLHMEPNQSLAETKQKYRSSYKEGHQLATAPPTHLPRRAERSEAATLAAARAMCEQRDAEREVGNCNVPFVCCEPL